jgi:hypothetical protein
MDNIVMRSNLFSKLLFWVTIVTIPTLSFTGRRLQHWLQETLSQQGTRWLVIFLLLTTLMAYLARHIGNWRRLGMSLILLLIPLLAILHYVPINEERVHFIVFGLLGFLSTTLFTLPISLIIGLGYSIGDELFQWLLPDRVGDVRDVVFNILAYSMGLLLALSERYPR